ncbi:MULTISPECIES: sensor histidine kinase [unclassified Paenibacillus]|uniref:sensor histidine kinase n=1 Tax=unclassified Paenibacillus TaxID=185978 RepID=UPI001AE93C65|nr:MULTISPECIES: sensor histidine kinase [unclassified Paenibacillus]MBP1170580.1 two-component system sensor histidine kinase YcbA [Paenibacillus sp. PvR098]MBP2441608.1 two-component system sensor histidine kinase YcbA [Paenibacillus sp. PvP052]
MRDHKLFIWVVILLSTALLGEVKITPFDGDFRFSLGIAAYFFGLLWFSIPVLATGISAGVFIVFFRVVMDASLYGIPWPEGIVQHLPVFFYYVTFAAVISLLKIKTNVEYPLKVGFYGAIADMASNVAELLIRMGLDAVSNITTQGILLIVLIGLLRSFFVVGLCNILAIRQVRAQGEQRRQELERLMLINSDLFEEAFYLRKSMSNIEDITRESYQLSKELKNLSPPHAVRALHIAENVHEIKKDSQRILSGLSKIIQQEQMLSKRVSISVLCSMVARANENYSLLLGKTIELNTRCDVKLSTDEIYPLLSVLNNIVSNAVESIEIQGRIEIRVDLKFDSVVFYVTDNGPGISSDELDLIFHPGYTTKFDNEGNSSTGIGLSHAADIVRLLGGDICVYSVSGQTRFEVRIPSERLIQREEAEHAEILSGG